ncbi:endolytic transglycosylase MltG [Clostridium peptidivorans]|uniref:endolytic transglycosylase MltG n=1 Tax=Clostridium peptidivorans TaxID=100174 RepID=UPI000BE3854F|nr:endolytic transglycosylase MltG [Clostridium peptidivorans]
MKKKLTFLIITLLILISASTYFIIYYNNTVSHPFTQKDGNVEVTVEKGDSLYKILSKLYNDKEIKNQYVIKYYIKKANLPVSIKQGSYEFNSDISLTDFMDALNKGTHNKNLVKLTIPEGFNIDLIANTIQETGLLTKEEFITAVKKYPLPEYVKNNPKKKYALEGYLYPDTYEFIKGTKAEDIIETMIKRFEEVFYDISKDSKLTKDDIDKIITVASMVEKESGVNEKGKVASVFYNRMEKQMKMQSCATVLYALGKHKDKLYYKDLEVKSPYNTYINNGLPPGPIASPSKESIEAALNPDKTDYLFFVSYNDGTHFFTNDYQEFLKVKEKTQGF